MVDPPDQDVARADARTSAPIIVAEGLSKTFRVKTGEDVHAVRDVSITLRSGDSLGLFGESGSGKSTLSRLILGLQKPDAGRVFFRGQDLQKLSARSLRRLRSSFGVVFQEPFESLDSLWTVRDIVGEPLSIHRRDMVRKERDVRIAESLRLAGLTEDLLDRYPGELSGGQQQRVGIARAIALKPPLLVLDEPTSSLDVSVRYQILATLARLRQEENLTFLMISHDLATVRGITSHVVVLRHGSIVESGETAAVFDSPQHPYTQKLVGAQSVLPRRPERNSATRST